MMSKHDKKKIGANDAQSDLGATHTALIMKNFLDNITELVPIVTVDIICCVIVPTLALYTTHCVHRKRGTIGANDDHKMQTCT